MNDRELTALILDWLLPITVRARWVVLKLDPRQPMAVSLAMLRGVWGRALHQLDEQSYAEVFEGVGPSHLRQAMYLLRPCLFQKTEQPDEVALEWLVIGPGIQHDVELCRAWDIASGMGLGRERLPFSVAKMERIIPHGMDANEPDWSPGRLNIPIENSQRACRVLFPQSLRLIHRDKLNTSPTLVDLVEAALNRFGLLRAACLGEITHLARPRDVLPDFSERLLTRAAEIPATAWSGQPLNLRRYSGRQKAEIEVHGVAGYIDLPEGLQELWPLFVTGHWLHLGKGTTQGLGRVNLQPR